MVNQSKYFRLSVTEKCNLSCYYCHNEGQAKLNDNSLSLESIVYMCKIAKEEGFTKFKLTGGEPTIRNDIIDIVKELSMLGVEDLSMITNGSLLLEKAKALKDAGLHRLNVTLNTLDYDKYKINQGGSVSKLNKVLKGIDKAISVGFTDMKINFVYTSEDSDADLDDLIEYVKDRSILLVVLPVIEFSDSSKDVITLEYLYNKFKILGIKSEEQFVDGEGIKKRLVKLNNGAKILLRVDELVYHNPYEFCDECDSRNLCREGIFPLRMSADGTLIPCLASDEHRISIKDAIETFDDVKIKNTINEIRRWKSYE